MAQHKFSVRHEEDCELIDICEQYDNVYKMCSKDAMVGNRCSPADKMLIKLLVEINEKLDKLIEEIDD